MAAPITFTVARSAPREVAALAVPVTTDGPVPRVLGTTRALLATLGFTGELGQALVLPGTNGTLHVATGLGTRAAVSAAALRVAAASAARALKHPRTLALSLPDGAGLDPTEAGQAVAEGITLAIYRYSVLKTEPDGDRLEAVTVVADGSRAGAVRAGVERGAAVAAAVTLARDLANSPPAYLTARQLADVAVSVAARTGLAVDVHDEHDLAELGCGGLLGVNQGSVEPPRLVSLTYDPPDPVGTVALVGKGITYDSGGLSLKPSDAMHAAMKMDMTGAAVVLATMSVLGALGCRVRVRGFLCCTDNMPSGSAMKLGDVLTMRDGTTVEIHNTDAEGRLVLADGLSLAVEEQPDAIVDIATLTGGVLRALGPRLAGLMGNDDGWLTQVETAAERADEPVWPLPLPVAYRKQLDSNVADLKNVGAAEGGSLIAGLFLQHFVGEIPWAHLDIASTMKVDNDEGWLTKGASAFGLRLLVELLTRYQPVAAKAGGARGH